MYTLFLDDERFPQDVTWVPVPNHLEIVVVRNYREFVSTIAERGIPSHVSFDHDLADVHYEAMIREVNNLPADYGVEKTGFDCAKWLVNFCHVSNAGFPSYAIHSKNPVGAQRIHNYIQDAIGVDFIFFQLP